MRGIAMARPPVETVLYSRRLRRSLVARPRLSGRLSRGAESRLTLSLEESDSQPASFWTYLITALQAAAPGVGTSALLLLRWRRRDRPDIPLGASLGIWLVVKGFNPSPITTGITA
jgi:ATP/maltotriose-dependent transcriptional regulator MalT